MEGPADVQEIIVKDSGGPGSVPTLFSGTDMEKHGTLKDTPRHTAACSITTTGDVYVLESCELTHGRSARRLDGTG